jgi:Spy/CpxP family protein refolding chaperone
MRNRNTSGLVFISFVLAVTLVISNGVSAQNSAPATGSSAQTPQATSPERPQTEPSQQNPAATPAPEPRPSSPGQPAASAPAAPQSQPAPPAGAQSSNQPKSIDEALQLTPDQKQKIAAVVDDENKQISAVRDDNSMSLEQKQQKVMGIRQAGTPKIKAILTPEQLQKLAVIQQRMREQNGGQGTSPTQPSQNAQPPQQSTPQH